MRTTRPMKLAALALASTTFLAACAEDEAEAPATSAATVEETTTSADAMIGTIPEVAAADGRFTTLLAAVEAAGLAETLSGDGPFTVFAPTDDAFAALPDGVLDSLLADPEGALTDVLLHHVVDGAVPAAEVVELDSATTMGGEEVSISVDGESVMVGDATVIVADVQAANGVIHVIDTVLVPSSVTDALGGEGEAATGTIIEVAAADGRFTTLLAAVEAASLTETLSGEDEHTVLAPTDDAFAALPEGTVDALLEDPEGALTDILLAHVIAGAVPAADVAAATEVTTANGTVLPVEVDGDVVTIGGATVLIADLQTANGIIHVIDAVIVPEG